MAGGSSQPGVINGAAGVINEGEVGRGRRRVLGDGRRGTAGPDARFRLAARHFAAPRWFAGGQTRLQKLASREGGASPAKRACPCGRLYVYGVNTLSGHWAV